MRTTRPFTDALALGILLMGCTSNPTETADTGRTDPTGATTSATTVTPSSPSPTAATSRLFLDEVAPRVKRLVEDFVDFALDPSVESAGLLPFAEDGVRLGLQSRLVGFLSVSAIHEPAAWEVNTKAGHVDGAEGPFSALELIQEHVRDGSAGGNGPRESGDLRATIGPHPNCVGPALEVPTGLDGRTAISLQPADGSITTCLAWFSVDLFLEDAGRIAAVIGAVWGP